VITITDSDLRAYLFGAKTQRAWKRTAGFKTIRRYYLSLANRAVRIGWSDPKISALIAKWHEVNRVEFPNGWEKLAEEMIQIAHRDTKPRRPARTHALAATPSWKLIQTALDQFAVVSPAEITEMTGLPAKAVECQLSRKLRLGWIVRRGHGRYVLTDRCGTQAPRKARRSAKIPVSVPIPETAEQRLAYLPDNLEELSRMETTLERQYRDALEHNRGVPIARRITRHFAQMDDATLLQLWRDLGGKPFCHWDPRDERYVDAEAILASISDVCEKIDKIETGCSSIEETTDELPF
jgi:hypothetical protein